ncbi:MAG: dipeptidase [Deltaproteobacteria bacterium]
MRTAKRTAAVLVAAFAVFLFGFAASLADRLLNPTFDAPIATSTTAAALHASLRVVDLHADSLVWERSLAERGTTGHVDVPRLIEGHVALQVLALPTKSPLGQNFERTEDGWIDQITVLGVAQLWPLDAWTSLEARAHLHAAELAALDAERDDLFVVRNVQDLDRVGEGGVAALLAIEGAHCLEGDVEAVDRLFAAGFRMFGLTHFFDNELGGSAHGVDKGGLTDFGRAVVERMEALSIVVDLAHASPAVIDDVLDVVKRPVVVSHTGVRGVCDNDRNLTDAQLFRIRDNGGVIGIGFWPAAVCGDDAAAIAKSIAYVADRIGADHVALGSDYDGAVGVPFDASGMEALTHALLERGMDDETIAKIMGENTLRVLRASLPN